MNFVPLLVLGLAHFLLQTEARTIAQDEEPFQTIWSLNEGKRSTINGHGAAIVEGDMLITEDEPPDNEEVLADLMTGDITKRAGVKEKKRLWPDDLVPFEFDRSLSEYAKKVILQSINIFNTLSCVQFRPRTSEEDWVIFTDLGGCFSLVGYKYWRSKDESQQVISIHHDPTINEARCARIGIVFHEMMHTVGFFHQQSRTDRNEYVRILWDNIIPGKENNFASYERNYVDNIGIYDHHSLMHYHRKAFSRNGLNTIEVINRSGKVKHTAVEVGPRKESLTPSDIQKLNALYKCKAPKEKKKKGKWERWSEWSACNMDCKMARTRLSTEENGVLKTQRKKCKETCKVDGRWGHWSVLSYCHRGKRERRRNCDNPPPVFGGKGCKGKNKEDSKQRCDELHTAPTEKPITTVKVKPTTRDD